MGTRISIRLAEFLQDPQVNINLMSKSHPTEEGELGHPNDVIENYVDVYLKNPDGVAATHRFDYYLNDGEIVLEADFNFFRDQERHAKLMRALFAHSIPFTVIPG